MSFFGVMCVAATVFTLVCVWRLRMPTAAQQMPAAVAGNRVLVMRPAESVSAAEFAQLQKPAGIEQRVITAAAGGERNRKLALLKEALPELMSEERMVVFADADVCLSQEVLDACAQALAEGADVAYAAPAPQRGHTWGCRAARAVLCHSHHDFRAIAAMESRAPSMCGKLMALSVHARGVLRALDDRIGEDLRLAEAVHAQGRRVVLVPTPVETLPSAASARFVRWMQVLRAHHPWRFLAVPFFFAPLPWHFVGMLGGALPPLLFALLFASRALLARTLTRQDAQWFFLAEPLLLFCFLRALVQPQVRWRGRTLQLGRGGVIRQ